MPRRKSPTKALTTLFGDSSSPIYVLAGDRSILYCNQALADWMGVELETLIGRHVEYHSQHTGGMVSGSAPGVAAGLCPAPTVFEGIAQTCHVTSVSPDGRLLYRRGYFQPLFSHEASESTLTNSEPSHAVLAVLEKNNLTPAKIAEHLRETTDGDALHTTLKKFQHFQAKEFSLASLLGTSPAMQTIRRQITLAAASTVPVSIVGRAGNGKSHIAKSIHYHPPYNAERNLSILDGNSLATEELEWTEQSLNQQRISSGTHTILIQHFEKTSHEVQLLCIKMLERPSSSIRFIATTERSLATLVSEGTLEPALAQLFSAIQIVVPSLSDRREDMPLLAQHFLEGCNVKSEWQVGRFQPAALEQLALYSWPAGLDELQSVVKAAHAAAKTTVITLQDLPALIHHAATEANLPKRSEEKMDLEQILAGIELKLIKQALDAAGGNKTKAAENLGLSRPKFYRRLEALGLIK